MNYLIEIPEMQYRMEKYMRAARMYNHLAIKSKKRGEHFGKWVTLRKQNVKFARQWQKDIKGMQA